VAISKYVSGKTIPSINFAIEWKRTFNENLIDLMLADEKPLVKVEEPASEYENLKDKLIATQEALIQCQQEKEDLKKNYGLLQNPEHESFS